jgi:hypothetical protein
MASSVSPVVQALKISAAESWVNLLERSLFIGASLGEDIKDEKWRKSGGSLMSRKVSAVSVGSGQAL